MPSKMICSVDIMGVEVPLALAISYTTCLYCGMMYQNPRLTDDARRRFYTDGLYKHLTATKNDYKTEQLRAERIMRFIDPLEPCSILDIGCGHGELLKACRDAGMYAIGVDLTIDTVEDVEVVSSLNEVDEKFHMVAMMHYLEHTIDPIGELKTALQYSERYVMAEVPLVDPSDTTKAYLNLPHTLIFEPWTLVSAFERAGMNVITMAISEIWAVAVGERAR